MAEQLKSVNNTQQRLQGAGANLLEGVAVALDGLGLALGAVKKAATTGCYFGRHHLCHPLQLGLRDAAYG
jgi:hypothetical protein